MYNGYIKHDIERGIGVLGKNKTKQQSENKQMYFCTMCGVQRGERITITDFLSKEEVNQIRKDKAYIKGDWNVFVQEMYITKALKIM